MPCPSTCLSPRPSSDCPCRPFSPHSGLWQALQQARSLSPEGVCTARPSASSWGRSLLASQAQAYGESFLTVHLKEVSPGNSDCQTLLVPSSVAFESGYCSIYKAICFAWSLIVSPLSLPAAKGRKRRGGRTACPVDCGCALAPRVWRTADVQSVTD